MKASQQFISKSNYQKNAIKQTFFKNDNKILRIYEKMFNYKNNNELLK